MTRIPIDPDGYTVNRETGTIHTRYVGEHGTGIRTRTVKGALTLLDGKKAKPCKECYPNPTYPPGQRSPTPQARRSGKTWREAALEASATVNSGAYPLDV